MTEKSDAHFLLDTNILVYNFDLTEIQKHRIALKIMEGCWENKVTYAVSLQNLSEFFVVSTGKINKPLAKDEAADIIKKINEIFSIYTENTKDFSKIDGIKAKNPFV